MNRLFSDLQKYPTDVTNVCQKCYNKDKDGWWLIQEPYRNKLEVRDNGALFFTSSYGNMPTELEVSADEKGVVKVTIKVNGQEFTSELERVEEN